MNSKLHSNAFSEQRPIVPELDALPAETAAGLDALLPAIALDHSGARHRLQFHHIYPKAVLKSSYTGREADDIANLAFIGGKTNRAISDKPPVEYFPMLIAKSGVSAFETQCILTDPALLGVESYKAFLSKRREMIAKRVNEFLGTTV